MKLTFKTSTAGAEAKLAALEKAAQSPAMFDAVGAAIKTFVNLGFKMGVDPWGKPWAPIKWRAPRRTNNGNRLSKTGQGQVGANRAGNAGQPLRDTGRLQRSITYDADATGVTIGTNIRAKSGASIARVHQFGAVIMPKKGKFLVFPGPGGGLIFAKKSVIPQRAFLPLKSPDSVVVLPVAWSRAVSSRIKSFLLKEATS